jgi:deoxyribodipyrimidine photolyase
MPAGGGARGAGILLWLRQDLRVHDNPALCAAATDARAAGGAVTCVYVHSPQEDGDDPAGKWRGGVSVLWVVG